MRVLVLKNTHTSEESGYALAKLATFNEMSNINGTYFEGLVPIKSSVDSYNIPYQDELWNTSIQLLAKDKNEAEQFNKF